MRDCWLPTNLPWSSGSSDIGESSLQKIFLKLLGKLSIRGWDCNWLDSQPQESKEYLFFSLFSFLLPGSEDTVNWEVEKCEKRTGNFLLVLLSFSNLSICKIEKKNQSIKFKQRTTGWEQRSLWQSPISCSSQWQRLKEEVRNQTCLLGFLCLALLFQQPVAKAL